MKNVITVKDSYNGKAYEIDAIQVKSGINGNPRYIVKASDLGMSQHDYDHCSGLYGFKKYRSKKKPGFLVFDSYYIQDTIYIAYRIIAESKPVITFEELKANVDIYFYALGKYHKDSDNEHLNKIKMLYGKSYTKQLLNRYAYRNNVKFFVKGSPFAFASENNSSRLDYQFAQADTLEEHLREASQYY